MTTVLAVLRRILAIFALPVALFLIWWYASADSTNFLLPPLKRILAAFPDTWLWDRFNGDVVPSLVRLAEGYALALLVGVALGVAIGSSRWLRSLVEPVLEFLRAVPPVALVPILFLLAGLGSTTKILVIISGCIWPILLNTVEGVRGVDPVLADTCRSYRVGGLLWLRTFVLRSASPQIVTGARQSLSVGIILMVISELKASSEGLGYTIQQFQQGFAYPQMWTGVLLLGLIGVLLSLIFRIVEAQVLGWYHGLRATERASR
ncbi:MAG TPA: ABC transporter permease [Micromonosporaceae bacterium]|jgi:ABC-type nitrate/sulfonate/bicarbonate transport system permease component